MKILAICGSGLGSSFVLELKIKEVLKELGVTEEVEVEHSDLTSATRGMADVYFATRDIADAAMSLGNVISLTSILNKEEIKGHLRALFPSTRL
ncbi:MAG: ascorbate system component [Verrucomicrobiota bacterium]|jgi:PTS system ascorbate-specific IIB component|nr:ascorbate system component [Verrucomicrobiota bacterium]MDK2962748.1 ascorbate system component [Verrucomicrobiota bacterium]